MGCRELQPLPRDFGEMGSLGAVSSLLLGPARAIPEPHPVRGGGQPEPLRVVGVQARRVVATVRVELPQLRPQ